MSTATELGCVTVTESPTAVPRHADGRRIFHPVSRWADHVEAAVSAAPAMSDNVRGRLLVLMATSAPAQGVA
ncbi:hypothetical protein [Corynebacterium sp. AOP12-C2-36]|uniref:hypothetical protein n=1 Tax=Corynebacterium sp. AOP12-C2-36 TaxID=3457723 RepID=UPI0040331CFB